jgi:3-oxoacyl-[acyl-carrier-protein] synthase II
VVFSGTSGFHDLARRERAFLDSELAGRPVRAYGGLVGHGIEAQFPVGMALAALSLGHAAKVPPFDPAEALMTAPAKAAIVTTIGHARGEGIAVLSAE